MLLQDIILKSSGLSGKTTSRQYAQLSIRLAPVKVLVFGSLVSEIDFTFDARYQEMTAAFSLFLHPWVGKYIMWILQPKYQSRM
jgi:hypothetical protein